MKLFEPQQAKRLKQSTNARIGLALLALVFAFAFVGPWIAPYDPHEQHEHALSEADGTPVGPNTQFWFGADTLGRDELSRLLHGGRTTLQVALLATWLATLVGLSIGLYAGYVGGFADRVLMRGVDIFLSLPFLLIAIALSRIVSKQSLWTLIVLLGLLSWTSLARITRTQTLQLKELEYMQAARALGQTSWRVVLRHLMPNMLGPVIVVATTLLAHMVIVESSMSFLGLGVMPPQASWGSMLREGQTLMTHSPRLVLFPGALIMATVFGFNLLGDALRDAVDPKD